MTTADYLSTPETVLPRELAYGELRVADAPTIPHQRVVLELALILAPQIRQRRLGELFIAPMDVVLDYDASLVVQPDLMVVSSGRARIVMDRLYGAPDLAIEVLSPHPRIGRLDERVEWFSRYGVRECWLVSLAEKQIAVLSLHERGVASRVVHTGTSPIQSNVLAGVSVTPLQIFGYS
jgi:Uma2 family endonuclease